MMFCRAINILFGWFSGTISFAFMEYIRCPLCESDQTKLIFRRKDFSYCVSDEEFCIVRCRKCGLVYVNPRPTSEELHHYYPKEFYNIDINPADLLKEKARQLELKYEYVKALRPGRLLDIGCQKGEFMFFMQQRGWSVQGVEWSTKPPNLFGLDICFGTLEKANHPPEAFDLVTLWAVLEHVYGPRKMLCDIHRLLKPGGKAVMLVTNFHSIPGCLLRLDDIPRHTTLFTKRTLGKMLRDTGFRPDRFLFNCELFGGTHRGLFNFVVKLMAGENLNEILAQNRSLARWQEFSSQLRSKPSEWMLKVDRHDQRLTPRLDRLFDKLHCGFIMTVIATRI
jgi:SAM-dependent methyltransferase